MLLLSWSLLRIQYTVGAGSEIDVTREAYEAQSGAKVYFSAEYNKNCFNEWKTIYYFSFKVINY